MNNNLFSWKEQSMLLKELLKLRHRTVAVGLGKEPPPGLQKLGGKMEFCRMWAEAQQGKAFFATTENHSCLIGAFHLGLRDEAMEHVCRFLVEEVYAYSPNAVKKYVSSLTHLNRKNVRLICLAPLEEATFPPSLVLVRCNPEQAMLLLIGVVL